MTDGMEQKRISIVFWLDLVSADMTDHQQAMNVSSTIACVPSVSNVPRTNGRWAVSRLKEELSTYRFSDQKASNLFRSILWMMANGWSERENERETEKRTVGGKSLALFQSCAIEISNRVQ